MKKRRMGLPSFEASCSYGEDREQHNVSMHAIAEQNDE